MRVPKVLFSNAYAKGSCSDRTKTAVGINEKIFSEIYKSYENTDYVSIRSLERIYKKILPEPVFLNIKKLTEEEKKVSTGRLETYFFENKTDKYKLLMISKNNMMSIKMLPTFMHESMHLLEQLLNPKIKKASEKLLAKSLTGEKNRLLSEYYYNNKHYADNVTNKIFLMKTKLATKKAIKNKKPEDKILILNVLRKNIMSEVKAFDETNKYATRLKKDKRKYLKIEVDKYYKSYMFDKKLAIIESLLRKTIQNERNRIKMEHSENICDYLKLFVMSKIFYLSEKL